MSKFSRHNSHKPNQMSRHISIAVIGLSFLILSFDSSFLESNQEIKVVAHRGASKFAPENTIAAFLKAAEMGDNQSQFAQGAPGQPG